MFNSPRSRRCHHGIRKAGPLDLPLPQEFLPPVRALSDSYVGATMISALRHQRAR